MAHKPISVALEDQETDEELEMVHASRSNKILKCKTVCNCHNLFIEMYKFEEVHFYISYERAECTIKLQYNQRECQGLPRTETNDL